MTMDAGPKFINLLDKGTDGAKEAAAGAICCFAMNPDNKVAPFAHCMASDSLWTMAKKHLCTEL